MTTRAFGQLCCLIIAVFIATPGCTTANAPRTGRYAVTAAKSPFYKYGPAQAFGADFALNRGQQVTVNDRSFGFSRVTTDDGISGYMATDDLAPLPAEPVSPLRPSARTASRRSHGEGESVSGPMRRNLAPPGVEGSSPLFDVSDVPLPTEPDKPKPAPPK